jgi:hypothetical protein
VEGEGFDNPRHLAALGAGLATGKIDRLPLHAQHLGAAEPAQCQPPASGPLVGIGHAPEPDQLLRVPDGRPCWRSQDASCGPLSSRALHGRDDPLACRHLGRDGPWRARRGRRSPDLEPETDGESEATHAAVVALAKEIIGAFWVPTWTGNRIESEERLVQRLDEAG